MSDLYVEHVEEIEFLWSQRADLLQSHEIRAHDLREHDERIEAHVQALLVPGLDVVPVIEHFLEEDDPGLVFAAAYPLLRLRDGAIAERIVSLYERAEGDRRKGFVDAFTHGPISQVQSKLERHYSPESPMTALATVRIMAFHDPKLFRPDVISGTARNDNVDVRALAWRTAKYGSGLSEATVKQGLQDPDPGVRAHAATAAAWGRYPGVLDHLRDAVRSATPEAFSAARLLAIVGDESDWPRLRPFAQDPQFGPDRFSVPASLGHPDAVDIILEGLADDDPAAAECAARAFRRITGVDVLTGDRAQPTMADCTDDFDVEFAPEYFIPDIERAREEWEKRKPSFMEGRRWCHGMEVTRDIDHDTLERVDVLSRAELCLRSAFVGKPILSAVDLEQFPQIRASSSSKT